MLLGGSIAGCTATNDDPSSTSSDTLSTSTGNDETTSPRTTDEAVSRTQKPSPERPEELTRETVVQYAKRSETTYQYNSVLETYGSDAANIQVDSFEMQTVSDQDGYYVLLGYTGFADYPDGLHVDLGSEVLYFVSQDGTKRVDVGLSAEIRNIDCEDAITPADSDSGGPCDERSGDGVAYRVVNLDRDTHTIDVQVELLGTASGADSAGDDTITQTYQLNSDATIYQGTVAFVDGTYRLTASIASDPDTTTTSEWEYQYPGRVRYTSTIIVTPSGRILITKPSHLLYSQKRSTSYCVSRIC